MHIRQILFKDIWQNHWTMKYIYFEVKCLIIRTHNPEVYVHTSNSLQDIMQNHWTMNYRSQWPTIIFRSNVGSYWFIIANNDIHTSNGLQDTRQNHWTIKYRSQWPTFILRSNLGSYWFIIPKYDVHQSLQDIRQNHWTMKYVILAFTSWPTSHTGLHFMTHKSMSRLSHVWPTICVICFHKSGKILFKGVLDSEFYPHPGVRSQGMKADPGYLCPNMNTFWWVVCEVYPSWETFMQRYE